MRDASFQTDNGYATAAQPMGFVKWGIRLITN